MFLLSRELQNLTPNRSKFRLVSRPLQKPLFPVRGGPMGCPWPPKAPQIAPKMVPKISRRWYPNELKWYDADFCSLLWPVGPQKRAKIGFVPLEFSSNIPGIPRPGPDAEKKTPSIPSCQLPDIGRYVTGNVPVLPSLCKKNGGHSVL